MKDYFYVKNQEDIDKFLFAVDNLHDACIRECYLLSRTLVDKDLSMIGYGEPSDLRVIFHSQFNESSVVDCFFEDVSLLCVYPDQVDFDPRIEITDEKIFFFLSSSRNPCIIAEIFKFLIVYSEYLGMELII